MLPTLVAAATKSTVTTGTRALAEGFTASFGEGLTCWLIKRFAGRFIGTAFRARTVAKLASWLVTPGLWASEGFTGTTRTGTIIKRTRTIFTGTVAKRAWFVIKAARTVFAWAITE